MSSVMPRVQEQPAVYVYEAPLRIWHWVNAFAIFALCLTGYFIGSPLPSVFGDTSEIYVMGWIRFIHFAAAYIMIAGFFLRIYWAFAGNEHARELFLPSVTQSGFWEGVWHEIKWYAFIEKEPRKYTGHNPLAVLAMHILFVWGSRFMMITGMALYGEGTGYDSWQYTLFSS